MKKWLSVFMLAAVAAGAFAGSDGDDRDGRGHHGSMSGIEEEVQAFLSENADHSIGDFTVGEVAEVLGRISVVQQEAMFVHKSRAASLMLPGLGQFMNKEPLSGALFLSADLLVTAGSLVGAYFLLPAELRFDQFDYLSATHTEIKALMASQSARAMLPAMGVAAGGAVVSGILRLVAAGNAGKLAIRNIGNGTVTFEPRIGFGGIGIRMSH